MSLAGPARAQDAAAVQAAVSAVEAAFGPEVPAAELWRGALDGVIAGLDARTGGGNAVLDAAGRAAAEAWLRGERRGIGAEYSVVAGQGLLLTEVFPGGPGARAGLEAGDLVVAVDDRPFVGLPAPAIDALVQGATGAKVALDVRRAGDRLRRFEVQRGAYSVAGVQVDTRAGVPVLRLAFFGAGTAAALEGALRGAAGAPGLVIDLRDNEGGGLDEAVAAAALFLPEGAVVLHRIGPDGVRQPVVGTRPRRWGRPVVLLVNEGTRGAAEAFAVALQAHGVARLVGGRTAGEARAPRFHPVGPGLVLRLMDTRLEGPTGQRWAGAGLQPELRVDPVAAALPPAAGAQLVDLQREAALRLIPMGAGR